MNLHVVLTFSIFSLRTYNNYYYYLIINFIGFTIISFSPLESFIKFWESLGMVAQ